MREIVKGSLHGLRVLRGYGSSAFRREPMGLFDTQGSTGCGDWVPGGNWCLEFDGAGKVVLRSLVTCQTFFHEVELGATCTPDDGAVGAAEVRLCIAPHRDTHVELSVRPAWQ
jgi:hypothetical protein